MKFKSLEVENFGPYKGSQSVSFPVDSARPLLVVFGDNMRGKTTFLNALRWVLYEIAVGRNSRRIDLIDLLNIEARREQEFTFGVRLELESRGDAFELRRRASLKAGVVEPRKSSDFDVSVSLRRSGSIVEADRISHYVNQFIPRDVSRFFLFDGELLQEYETLLVEDSKTRREIRVAIEQILGVPSLTNGRDQLRSLLKDAEKAQARDMRHVEALKSHAEHSERLRGEIEAHERDCHTLKEQIDALRAEVDRISEELDAHEDARATEKLLRQRSEDVEAKEAEIGRLQDEMFDALRSGWRLLLRPRIILKLDELQKLHTKGTEKVKSFGALEQRISILKNVLASDSCIFCGNQIDEEHRRTLGKRLGELESALERAEDDQMQLTELGGQISLLQSLVTPTKHREPADIERDQDRERVHLESLLSEIDELEDRLRGHDVAAVARLQSRRDGLQKTIGQSEERLRAASELLDEKTAKLRQLAVMMGKNPQSRKVRSSYAVKVIDELEKIFSESIDELRTQLKADVEQSATAIFKQLTTEKTYRGLRINDSYGLSIIDSKGEEVAVRSAGAEQVVAMSLLGALNETAAVPAPLVTDTPFGRLDPKHRLNIMKFIPGMAEQVVLLVHAGEIDPETGLEPVAEVIGGRYEIQRVTATHSQLKRLT